MVAVLVTGDKKKPQIYVAPVGTPLDSTEGWTRLGEVKDMGAHDRWVGIDWVYDPALGRYRILSHGVTQCTCETPWRHYP